MKDSTLTQIQASTLTTLGGTTAGAGIGAAVYKEDRKKGAIIGGIAGGVLGAAFGKVWADSIVKEKQAYASQEAYLQDNIAQVKKRIKDAESANKGLAEEIAALQKSKTVDQQRLAEIKTNIDKCKSLINKDISTARSALASGDANMRAELKQQIGALTSQRDLMAQRMNNLQSLARKI